MGSDEYTNVNHSGVERTVDERPSEEGDDVRECEAHFCDIECVKCANVYSNGTSESKNTICVNDGKRKAS
jgi:hypothetical protein